MASAVQTKKKRDKKKKKEDSTEEFIPHPPITTPPIADDVNIHVYKEASTGGGLCAKLVFFALLTLLSTLIGLIITEHRGLTDLETINTESAFAHIFEGWIDKTSDIHDDEGLFRSEHSQENEDDEDDEHDQSLHDEDEDDEENHNEGEISEETKSQMSYEDNEEERYIKSREDEEDEDTQEDEDDDEAELETQEEDVESATQEEEQDTQEEDVKSTTQEEQGVMSDTREDNETEEELPETQRKSEEKEKYELNESSETTSTFKEKDMDEETYVEKDIISRLRRNRLANQREQKDKFNKERNIQADNEESEEMKESEESAINHSQKDQQEAITQINDGEEIENESDKESSNMIVRFGVGTALLVVAHIVLIKKWRTAKISINKPEDTIEDDENIGIDLSRRNTIISPPELENIGQDFEELEEDYSEEEDYNSEEDRALRSSALKKDYEQLQSAYSYNLSPNWEPKREYDHSENEEEDEQEAEDDEEGYDEEEEEIECGDEDISENEDEELLRRLEARYGILRQNFRNVDDEEEEEGEEEEEDESDYDEEDGSTNYNHWKREKFVPIKDSDSEDEKNWSNQRSGAQSSYDFSNITNVNDWKIRTELDRAGQMVQNE